MFKQNILFNGFIKKQNLSTFLVLIRFHFLAVISPTLENSLSEATEGTGIVRNFLAWGTQKGKSYLVFSPPLQRMFFSGQNQLFKDVLTTILESTVEGLDCCVANELSMNDHNADGSCSDV